MRITNKIMQRNNLSNINTNKIYQDKLSTQMSTQKKISRPSDDPVVAIRALRLRSNVTEITQYYSKNIPDAKSWLSVTEDALKNQAQIMTEMIKQCTKGANGDLKSTDRQVILEQLKGLAEEVYSTANADYAGRYVFTGYRTDTPLSFIKEETMKYQITEQLHKDSVGMVTKVNLGDVLDITANNFADMTQVDEDSISSVDVYRIQLAYNHCCEEDDGELSITTSDPDIAWTSDDFEIIHSTDDPYTKAANDPDAMIYVPETGEILMGKKNYDKLMSISDDPLTTQDESEIRVSYTKNSWEAGDLRPEHYFACKNLTDDISYNQEYLQGNVERQDIEYDVGFNQTIRVNSTADECFQHGIGRTVDDLVNAIQEVVDLETVKCTIESALETAEGEDAKILQQQLLAADKALTLSRNKCQKMFEAGITTFQGYLDDANLCITNCGTRSSKLELISNRMQNQKTTFETLKSENEDVDITEVAIQLNSAELTYEAALMAAGKVMQTTLLNFI
ncbi:MAG: flagellar hook-associated protein FlgL [Roseburia sp.]|nr:flagellar hook-associated protein FlgL [Roseburia sp.]